MKASGIHRTKYNSNTNSGENLIILSFLQLIQFCYFVELVAVIGNLSYLTGGI